MYNIIKMITATCAVFATTASISFASTISPTTPLPSSLERNVVQSATATLYAEQTDVTVGAGDVTVDYLASSVSVGQQLNGIMNFRSGENLAAGKYDSFLIHFDPISAGSATGTFTFENEISAIILSNGSFDGARALLNESDSVFGAASTTYEETLGRRAENPWIGFGGDWVKLVNANTLQYSLTSNTWNIDNVRVLTEVSTVPLPAGGLLLLGGLVALALQRRRKTT